MQDIHIFCAPSIFEVNYILLFFLITIDRKSWLSQIIYSANEEYSGGFKHGTLAIPPSRKLAVLACMDARLTVEDFLGLGTGDAHIIRNAVGSLTDDAIRSLIISHETSGNARDSGCEYTDCGMLAFTDAEQ